MSSSSIDDDVEKKTLLNIFAFSSNVSVVRSLNLKVSILSTSRDWWFLFFAHLTSRHKLVNVSTIFPISWWKLTRFVFWIIFCFIGKSGNGGWKRLWRTPRLITFSRYRRQMKGLLLLFITITDDRRVKLWTFADLSVRTYFFFTTAISLRTHTFFCDSNSLRTQCHFE
jgi:hypothetical protein